MKARVRPTNKITLPAGFSFSSACAGIKASGRPDLALVEACPGTTAAARVHEKSRCGRASRGGTRSAGGQPRPDSRRDREFGQCQLRHRQSRDQGLPASLPGAGQLAGSACQRGISIVHRNYRSPAAGGKNHFTPCLNWQPAAKATKQGIAGFARAIMTTDTRPKLASAQFSSGKASVNVLGIAKGAGMIHPQLATMLVYLFTDVAASSGGVEAVLARGLRADFQLHLDRRRHLHQRYRAAAGQRPERGAPEERRLPQELFAERLLQVCQSLAEQIVCGRRGSRARDSAVGRAGQESAKRPARWPEPWPIRLLVKTAWAGADPNWGRILAAVGRSGIAVESGASQHPDRRSNGMPRRRRLRFRRKAGASGSGQARHARFASAWGGAAVPLRFLTTDLTAEYVRINADYST